MPPDPRRVGGRLALRRRGARTRSIVGKEEGGLRRSARGAQTRKSISKTKAHSMKGFILLLLLMPLGLMAQKENFMGEEGDEDYYDMLKREPKYSNADKTCLW